MRLQRLLVDHSTWLYSLLASRRVGTTVRWRQRLSPGLECRTWVPCRGLDCNGEALACAEHHVGSCRSSASMSKAGWRTPEGRMALTRTCFYPRRAPFQRHLPLLGEAPAPSFTQVSSDDSPCFAVTRERPDALAFRRSLALRTQLWLRSHVLSERDTCRPTSSGAAAVSDGKPARHLARWHPAGNALSLWMPVRCLLSR